MNSSDGEMRQPFLVLFEVGFRILKRCKEYIVIATSGVSGRLPRKDKLKLDTEVNWHRICLR